MRVDHLVYAVPDLAIGAEGMESLLGVRPSLGGSHPGLGTRNVLLSLGDGTYLEAIGPDPEQPRPSAPRPFGIDALEAPRLVTWCARPLDLDRAAADARAAGVALGEVESMGRARADGTLLEWRLTSLFAMPADGLVPFLIDWGATPHPSRSAASGCSFVELRAEHPDPEAVRKQLSALGIDMAVGVGSEPALIATLETPSGRVELR